MAAASVRFLWSVANLLPPPPAALESAVDGLPNWIAANDTDASMATMSTHESDGEKVEDPMVSVRVIEIV